MPSSAASSTASDRHERGQASVELALALPFVVLLLLLVVQVLLVARAQAAVDQAAREAGRVAAVGGDRAAAGRAALEGGLPPARTSTRVGEAAGGSVTVVVRLEVPTDVPVVGVLVPDVVLEGRATFRREGGSTPG